ncbi:MAG: AMP-binding protein [Betaproteobacteria bacterium]
MAQVWGSGTGIDPQCAQAWRHAGYWPERLITDDLDAHAASTPDRIAFVDSRRSIRYDQLQHESFRLADALRQQGMASGDVVAVQWPNWIEFAVMHLALVRLGAIIAPVTPMSRLREMSAMLRISRAKWLAVVDRFRGFDHGGLAQAVLTDPAFAHVQPIVLGETGSPAGALSYEVLLSQGRDEPRLRSAWQARRPSADDITEIVFTSGTTADPKGVLHTHNTLMAPQLAMAKRLGLRQGVVLHMASTVAHQTGFLNGLRLPVQMAGTAVLQDVWKPEFFMALVEQHRIEVSSGSATFLLDVLRTPGLERHDLSSLRLFRAGGGPIPEPLVREAESRLPHLRVVRGWGQTENGVVTMTFPDDPQVQRTGSDGYAQPGMEVRVVDAQGDPVPVGGEGRLQCRGAALCVGYANDVHMLRDACADGWFDTGDLAVLTDHHCQRGPGIRISGRVKDLIIRGGENIPVHHVENMLFEDPRISEVAIVGMPDERLGERACAFVICRSGHTLDLAGMRQHLAAVGVAAPYWPERLEVVEELPRSANGKVLKTVLRTRLREPG